MGKLVKTVLKVAAVAAIAYFAPPLAAAIGSSVGVTSAIGTTALAAGIGAGAGELAGVGWQAGAFAGGLSAGGQSGLFGGKPPPGTAGAGGGTAGTAGAGAGAGTATTASPFLNPSTPASLSGYPAAANAGVSPFLNPSTPTLLAAPTAATAAGAGGGSAMTLGGALSKAASNPVGALGSGVKSMTTGLGSALGAVGIGSGTLNLGAVAPTLLAAGLVGNPGGDFAKAQEAELKRAQAVNAALTQQRLDQANQLISDAGYYDPEYMARQAAEAAAIRGGIQATEATRGLTGERLAAERRRYRLGTAKNVGTAYQQGYGTGVGARVQTRQAGISAIPTEYPMASSQSAMLADANARQARSNEIAGLSALFGQVLGQGAATSMGA